jgi:hypothetical protein
MTRGHLEISSLGLLVPLSNFTDTDLKKWNDPEWLIFFHLLILADLAKGMR